MVALLGGASETYRLVISVGGTLYGEYGSGRAITTTTSGTLSAYIYVGSGTTVNLTYYPMLTSGSTQKPYQKYVGGQASPNPTYPQDINVVTGTQEVVVQNKNLFNKDTITENQRIDPSGNKNYDENCDLSDYIKIQPNTTYTRNITASVYECIAFYTSEKVFISRDTAYSTTTSPNNAYYVRLSCYKTNLDTLQFELGSTSSSYVEHQEQTKTLHLGDIELAKIGTYQDRIFKSSGKNLFGDTLRSGVTNYQTGAYSSNATRLTSTNWTFLKAGTYTISAKNSASKILQISNITFDKDNNYYEVSGVSGQWKNLPFTITLPQDTNWKCNIEFSDASTIQTMQVSEVQLELGTTTTSYEPYGSGKWYIEKNIYKIANKTNWVVGNIASNNRCPIPLNSNGLADTINSYNGINCISNCLIATSQGTQATSTDINTISINNANAYVKFDDATNTRELVKAKLDSMTNFVLYYILNTPTYEEITNTNLLNELNEIEKMMSYNGQTNISVSGNLPMILDITALKGESE